MMPVRAYVALGSNLGDRAAALAFARRSLSALPGTLVRAASGIEETAPLHGLDQPAYLNQMLALDTHLAATELLAACHRIEVEAGRVRSARWDSRTLDVDIVTYGDLVREDEPPLLPHPGLADRDFWWRELKELHDSGW